MVKVTNYKLEQNIYSFGEEISLDKIETPSEVHVHFENDIYITDLDFQTEFQSLLESCICNIFDKKYADEIQYRIVNLINKYASMGAVRSNKIFIQDIPYVHLKKSAWYDHY